MKAAIAILAIVPALAEDARVIERVFTKDSDLYAVYAPSGDAARLTADGLPKQFVTISPDRVRVAFVVNARKSAVGTIVVISADSVARHDFVFRPEPATAGTMQSLDDLAWLNPHRLVVSGTVNPPATEYAIITADTGRELHSYFVRGSAWSPSPGGAHVAYEYYARPRFCVDDECRPDDTGGYPRPNRNLEFQWPPAWSADESQVAILAKDVDRRSRQVVIVKRIAGPAVELPMPPEADGYAALLWDGPDLLLTSVKFRWKRSPDRAEFVRLPK